MTEQTGKKMGQNHSHTQEDMYVSEDAPYLCVTGIAMMLGFLNRPYLVISSIYISLNVDGFLSNVLNPK